MIERCLVCDTPLPRHDDTPWALPTREPAKELTYGATWDSPGQLRAATALEQIAKTLELVRLEISMMNMTKDRVIR